MENQRTTDEEVIGQEVKSPVKDLIANERSTLVEESLKDNVWNYLQNAQRSI